jgi:hypothetical protein
VGSALYSGRLLFVRMKYPRKIQYIETKLRYPFGGIVGSAGLVGFTVAFGAMDDPSMGEELRHKLKKNRLRPSQPKQRQTRGVAHPPISSYSANGNITSVGPMFRTHFWPGKRAILYSISVLIRKRNLI